MKRTSLIALLAAAFLLLSGCSLPPFLSFLHRADAAEPAEGVLIYRLTDTGSAGELIRAETVPVAGDTAPDIDLLLSLFTGDAADDTLRSALPDGVTVAGWTLSNGVVTLELSGEYWSLPQMDRTATAFCAALTLCQLESVEAVTVTAGGEVAFTGLTEADALLDAADSDPFVRQLRLYFADADGRYLMSEYHSLTLDEETSPERYVVEELLRGPNGAELHSVLPAGTELRSCRTEGGVCTVDLSAAFYDNRPDTALEERLCIYSLVDSLTALSGVDSVQILVEGQPVDAYAFRPLSEPLSRYDEPIGPVSAPKGEFDADLYLPLPGLETLAPLPFRVMETDYESRAEAVLAALMTAEEPGYPFVFPGTGSVTDISTRGSVCTVDLSESFFVSLPEEARLPAVRSISATICGLPSISAVRFTVGGADAVFDGVDYSGPWRQYNNEKIEVN